MSALWADLAEGDMGVRDECIRAVAGVLNDLELDEGDGIEILIKILGFIGAESGQGMALISWLANEIQEAEDRMGRMVQ